MCLHTILRGREKKEALAKLEDTITVWKVVNRPYAYGDGWTTDHMGYPIHAGEVTFNQNIIHPDSSNKYRGGGHFWLTKAGAFTWGVVGREKLVRCTVKKTDINTIGSQCGIPVVVVKKATFPKYLGSRKGGN